ncbi:hypothetical protein ACWGKW_28440 [Streptomyces sp. NPDC054766]
MHQNDSRPPVIAVVALVGPAGTAAADGDAGNGNGDGTTATQTITDNPLSDLGLDGHVFSVGDTGLEQGPITFAGIGRLARGRRSDQVAGGTPGAIPPGGRCLGRLVLRESWASRVIAARDVHDSPAGPGRRVHRRQAVRPAPEDGRPRPTGRGRGPRVSRLRGAVRDITLAGTPA